MTTVYIDVYFLINFTVDLLAFYLAAAFLHVRIGNARLLSASFLSAVWACFILFVDLGVWGSLLSSCAAMILISYVWVGKISLVRRGKLLVSFVLFLTVIGGMVYFAFNVISRYFPEQVVTTVHDRKLLIFSMLVLLSLGAIRLMMLMFFHSTSERSVHLVISLMGRQIECDALVDSGNLLKDPIDLTPVMLIKSDMAKGLFPNGIPTLSGRDGKGMDRFIRLIPINKNGHVGLQLGIRAERVLVSSKKGYTEAKLTFIIDEEKGSFGGFEALVPSSALDSI